MQPYVGIAGITTREQSELIISMKPDGMTIALGVIASAKTFSGGENNARSPRWSDVRGILPDATPEVLRVLHYYSRAKEAALHEELQRALSDLTGRIDAVQLNLTWPGQGVCEWLRKEFPSLAVILQVGPAAMEFFGYRNMASVANACWSYAPHVDGFLLDFSAGKGEPIDPARAWDVLEAIWARPLRDRFDRVTIGIAGGLGLPGSIARIEPLLQEYPRLSVDAESALRNERDELDMGLVANWLEACEHRGLGWL